MKVSFDYKITIFGKTYEPTEIEKTRVRDTNKYDTHLVYHIDKKWTLIITASDSTFDYLSLALTKKKINLDTFMKHQHIAPPDFALVFCSKFEELESDIEELFLDFDNQKLFGDMIKNLID